MLRRPWQPATIGLFVAIVLILLGRDLTILTSPALEYEDASHIFAYFYGHRHFFELFRFKAGYVPLLPNLIGFIAVRLPTRLIPYGLAVPPLLLTAIAYSTFFAEPFRRYVRSDLLRGLTCLLLALAPLAHYALIASTDYCIWNALFLLILLLLLPAPAPLAWQAGRWSLATLLIWSNPLSLVCMPLVLDGFRREKQARAHHLAILASLSLYQFLGVSHLSQAGDNILNPIGIVRAIALGVDQGARSMLRALFGPGPDLSLSWSWSGLAGFSVIMGLLLLMIGAICFYARTSGSDAQRFSMHAGFLIMAIPALSALGRGVEYISQYQPRYIYCSSLLAIILMVAVIEAIIVQAQSSRFQEWARRWSCCWLLLSSMSVNIQQGYYQLSSFGASHDSPYGQNRIASQRITRFFDQLAVAESRQPPSPVRLGLDRGPKWSFEVRVRPRRQ